MRDSDFFSWQPKPSENEVVELSKDGGPSDTNKLFVLTMKNQMLLNGVSALRITATKPSHSLCIRIFFVPNTFDFKSYINN